MAFDPQWLLYAVLFILVVVLVVRYGKALLLVGALLSIAHSLIVANKLKGA